MIGTKVRFTITYGLTTQEINGVVIQYLGNQEYVVEGENKNRYIRRKDELRGQ